MGFMKMKQRFDKRSTGIIFGVVTPIIAFIAFWQFKYGEKDVEQLWYYMTLNSANRNDLLIFPLLPNLVMFYFSNFQWRWDNFTTGLVGTTIGLSLPIVIALIW